MIYITIDTSIFERMQFDFSNAIFIYMKSLIDRGDISMILSEVIDREIVAHLKIRAEEHEKQIKKVKKSIKCAISKQHYIGLNNKLSEIDFKKEVLALYDNFKKDLKVEIVPIRNVDIDKVFDKYFKSLPPFSQKKKEEFPDAFALESLMDFSTQNGKLKVVTDDTDWVNACRERQIDVFDTILAALTNFSTDVKKEVDTISFVELNNEYLIHIIKTAFDDYVYNLSYHYDDSELIDSSIEVKKITMDGVFQHDNGDQTNIFEIGFKAQTYLRFGVNEYADGYYDKEDDKWLYLPYKEYEIDGVINGWAVLIGDVSYSNNKMIIDINSIEISDIVFDLGDDYENCNITLVKDDSAE